MWVEGGGSPQFFFHVFRHLVAVVLLILYSSCFHRLWEIFLFLHNVFPPQLIFLECFYSTHLLFSSKFVLRSSVMLLNCLSYLGLGGFFAS